MTLLCVFPSMGSSTIVTSGDRILNLVADLSFLAFWPALHLLPAFLPHLDLPSLPSGPRSFCCVLPQLPPSTSPSSLLSTGGIGLCKLKRWWLPLAMGKETPHWWCYSYISQGQSRWSFVHPSLMPGLVARAVSCLGHIKKKKKDSVILFLAPVVLEETHVFLRVGQALFSLAFLESYPPSTSC